MSPRILSIRILSIADQEDISQHDALRRGVLRAALLRNAGTLRISLATAVRRDDFQRQFECAEMARMALNTDIFNFP